MQKSLVLLLSLVIATSTLHGQTASGRIPKAKPVTKPEEAEKKPGFFKRIFGKKEEVAPEAPPKPEAKPESKPTARPRSRPRPKPGPETETPADTVPVEQPKASPPKPAEVAKPAGMPPEENAKPGEKPKAKVSPPKPADEQPQKPAKPDYSGMSDAEKYKAVRERAIEDEKIKELAKKADTELSATGAASAAAEYNRALFQKIRQLEPSLDRYVDGVEAAMTKRLAAEKKAK